MMDVTEYIPQRRPFVFVDDLLSHSQERARTVFRVREDTPFVRDGVFTAPGVVEFIAQSCALKMGYEDWLAGRREVAPGMIGALSSVFFHSIVCVGDEIVCELEIVGEYDTMIMVSANVLRNGECIAGGSMKIVRNKNLDI